MTADATSLSIAARLIRDAGTASLGTLLPGGAPCVTLVSVAASQSGEPLFLLSNLALHTRNIAADPRISLLLQSREPDEGEDPRTASRLTLTGSIARVDSAVAKAPFLAAHPEASDYANFSDFGFYAMTIERGHLVAGFGRIVEIGAEALRAQFA